MVCEAEKFPRMTFLCLYFHWNIPSPPPVLLWAYASKRYKKPLNYLLWWDIHHRQGVANHNQATSG